MAAKTQKNGETLHDKLNALEAQGRIPYVSRGVIQQKRWQREPYPSGVFYSTPSLAEPDTMGRYNDPTERTGICYTADYASVAIAESLGRVYQRNRDGFVLGLSDLKKAHLYTLETTRGTKTIDMSRLQGMLHITADKTMGDDQSVTWAVTDWAANTPGLDYDGITYSSRHYGVGTCTAFWKREGMTGPLADVANSPVDSYLDNDAENFPQNWTDIDIDGLEIVAKTLGYEVHLDK